MCLLVSQALNKLRCSTVFWTFNIQLHNRIIDKRDSLLEISGKDCNKQHLAYRITSVERNKNLSLRRDPMTFWIWNWTLSHARHALNFSFPIKLFLCICVISGPRRMLFMHRKWSRVQGYQRTGMNVPFSRIEFFDVISLQVIKRRPHLWVGKGPIMESSITSPLMSNLNKQTCLSAP